MVFFSSRISPRTSTVILRERSPRATAVVTSAILRTWAVRFPAMKLTLSVRSFHVPPTPVTTAWPPSFPSVPTSRATRVTSAADIDLNLAREVAAGNRRGYFGDVAHLGRQVSGHGVYAIGQILPRARNAFYIRLAAEFSLRTHFTGHARDFRRERAELIHHGIDGVLELQDLAAHVDRNLAREIAARHRGGHFGDVADLIG